MATTIFEGFSISHAAILDPSGAGADQYHPIDLTDGGFYGVREGSLAVDMDSYDNTGDDSVLSTWFWFNFATVTITGGYVPFKLISLLSGSAITSSGAAPNDYYNLPLWEQTSLNQPTRAMMVRVPSKDSVGAVRNFDIVLYKVQFNPINFDGPSYKNGLLLNYSGRALMSGTDERNGALATRAIGRLLNHP